MICSQGGVGCAFVVVGGVSARRVIGMMVVMILRILFVDFDFIFGLLIAILEGCSSIILVDG